VGEIAQFVYRMGGYATDILWGVGAMSCLAGVILEMDSLILPLPDTTGR